VYISLALVGQWTPPPPTSGFVLVNPFSAPLIPFEVQSGWDDGDVDGDLAVDAPALTPSLEELIIPPGGVAQFNVSVIVAYSIDNGLVDFDFESGGFEILRPLVELVIVSQ